MHIIRTLPCTPKKLGPCCWLAGWAGLAVTADVPEPGDAVPLEFMGIPLLLLRDRSGTVRVFQNICRHRSMTLVEEPRKIEGAIRCPYP